MINKKIAAIVILYNPINNILEKLIKSIYDDVDHIILVDNSDVCNIIYSNIVNNKIIYLFNNENYGISKALNKGISHSIELQCEYVITFDQDSNPSNSMVSKLLLYYQNISIVNPMIGAIGPALVDSRDSKIKYPFLNFGGLAGFFVQRIYPDEDVNYVPVDLLITSGMLFDVKIWMDGYKFIDELFIDYVDTEWCIRTSASGYKHFGCPSVKMLHSVSDVPGKRVLGLLMLGYSSFRRFYYYRNTCLYAKMSYVPIGNRLRMIIGAFLRIPFIFLYDEKPFDSYGSIFKGIYHGIRIKISVTIS